MTPLTDKEKNVLAILYGCIEDGLQTNEIVDEISDKLKYSPNTTKGYLGKLVQKGYITRERYKDFNIGWITQFSMNQDIVVCYGWIYQIHRNERILPGNLFYFPFMNRVEEMLDMDYGAFEPNEIKCYKVTLI